MNLTSEHINALDNAELRRMADRARERMQAECQLARQLQGYGMPRTAALRRAKAIMDERRWKSDER